MAHTHRQTHTSPTPFPCTTAVWQTYDGDGPWMVQHVGGTDSEGWLYAYDFKHLLPESEEAYATGVCV